MLIGAVNEGASCVDVLVLDARRYIVSISDTLIFKITRLISRFTHAARPLTSCPRICGRSRPYG